MISSPKSPQVIYGVGWGINLYKSSDGGKSWTTKGLGVGGAGDSVALDPQNENVIYVGGHHWTASLATGRKGRDRSAWKAIVLKSKNGGQAWSGITGKIQGTWVYALAVDSKTPSRVFAGTDVGLYRSENAGASWTEVLKADIRCVKVLSSSPKAVYAGGPSGFYLSQDNGQTWTESVEGMTAKYVQCLDTDKDRKTVYAGTYGGSILKIRR
jgi:photosystem II stability/assembly factor-like uncharacterized protein